MSESTIDTATFQEWQARQKEAAEVAATAKANPTVPPTQSVPKGSATAPGTTAGSEAGPQTVQTSSPDAEQSAGQDAANAPKVQVAGEPGKAVATPDNSTDLPEQAGLETADEPKAPDPFLIRLQVLLDRADASPGVIDGFLGENTRKAIRAYEAMRKLPVDGKPNADLWNVLVVDQGKAMKTYTITKDDVSGRYVQDIPSDYAKLAEMKWLGYRGPAEKLAEKFHMDEDLLKALNPQTDFSHAGDAILVADTGAPPSTKVMRITVDKEKGELTVFDGAGNIVMSAPATIGSQDTPSPSGKVTVVAVAQDPTYEYDPHKNFTQGDNHHDLTIPPGPNGPVGLVWIALSKPTYGIHGTPNPSLIDKDASHGCVRLTNWDAEALSKLVQPKETRVEFTG
ncbi:L,D-transpeptidase family protein [Jiella sp. M17.18]|uniref:L,D-transpeptidase family protein n=1 Tax=Jiella sp. M17.18 TaxID=3234247 RepID=UPI0034DE75D8